MLTFVNDDNVLKLCFSYVDVKVYNIAIYIFMVKLDTYTFSALQLVADRTTLS